MVFGMEAPLRCSFWLERQTTLQSRNRSGIFRAAVKTRPERMKNHVEQDWLRRRRVRAKRLRRSSYNQLTTVSSETDGIACPKWRTPQNRRPLCCFSSSFQENLLHQVGSDDLAHFNALLPQLL